MSHSNEQIEDLTNQAAEQGCWPLGELAIVGIGHGTGKVDVLRYLIDHGATVVIGFETDEATMRRRVAEYMHVPEPELVMVPMPAPPAEPMARAIGVTFRNSGLALAMLQATLEHEEQKAKKTVDDFIEIVCRPMEAMPDCSYLLSNDREEKYRKQQNKLRQKFHNARGWKK